MSCIDRAELDAVRNHISNIPLSWFVDLSEGGTK
jgi:hypothetical protein